MHSFNKSPQSVKSPSWRISSQKIALAAILSLGLVAYSFGQRPVVGAIRWDAWCHDASTILVGEQNVGLRVERSLSPSQHHYRVPFFGRETGPNSVTIDGRSQAVMDQEIAYAKDAGIDYWAFLYYPDGSGLDYARNLYNLSTHKDDVKACYIVGSFFPTNSTNLSWLMDRFQEANYQKVLNGRPLIYIYARPSNPYSLSNVSAIRNAASAQGIPNPYVVVMAGSNAKTIANDLGADAISDYVSGAANNGGPYAPLIPNTDLSRWNDYKATGKKVIPWMTDGWNVKPRIDTPIPNRPPISATAYVGDGTPQEIGQHLQDAINWVNQNPTTADANAIIMYSWNEYDEGGALCPTITPGNNSLVNRSRLDAIKQILNPTPTCLVNEAWNSLTAWNTSTSSGTTEIAPVGQLHLRDNTNAPTSVYRTDIAIPTTYTLEFSAKVDVYTNASTGVSLGVKVQDGVYRLMFRRESDGFYALTSSSPSTWVNVKSTSAYTGWGDYKFEVVNGSVTMYSRITGNTTWNNVASWSLAPNAGSDRLEHWCKGSSTAVAEVHVEYTKLCGCTGCRLASEDANRIAEQEANNLIELRAFPVPTTHQLTIRLQAKAPQTVILRLHDLSGREVIKSPHQVETGNNEFQLKTSSLSGGLYILSAVIDDRLVSQRIQMNP